MSQLATMERRGDARNSKSTSVSWRFRARVRTVHVRVVCPGRRCAMTEDVGWRRATLGSTPALDRGPPVAYFGIRRSPQCLLAGSTIGPIGPRPEPACYQSDSPWRCSWPGCGLTEDVGWRRATLGSTPALDRGPPVAHLGIRRSRQWLLAGSTIRPIGPRPELACYQSDSPWRRQQSATSCLSASTADLPQSGSSLSKET